jgi:ribosomal protein L32
MSGGGARLGERHLSDEAFQSEISLTFTQTPQYKHRYILDRLALLPPLLHLATSSGWLLAAPLGGMSWLSPLVRIRQSFHRLSPMMLGPAVSRLLRPDFPTPALDVALAGGMPAIDRQQQPVGLFDGLLLAVQKKRTSYTRKRIRQAGKVAARGPKLQETFNMCPVCERMRQPHRVCDREDCSTMMRSRWF